MTHSRDATSDSGDFTWAIPVMRAGYLGRCLVYLVVAGISLWSIWRGGRAEGTSDAFARLRDLAGGPVVLALILVGMLCYGIWRVVDAVYDLEDYGTDVKGIIARGAMIVTGLAHLGVGGAAGLLLLGLGGGDSDGGGSDVARGIAWVMALPGGWAIVGLAGLGTIGAGAYYLHKGWTRKYREHLRAGTVTERTAPVLTVGVIAQGVIVGGVGGLLVLAAYRAQPGAAGGIDKVFEWAYSTPFGWAVVIAICIGLLAFAAFCAVNAIWRIVPRASGPDVETLARYFAEKSGAT